MSGDFLGKRIGISQLSGNGNPLGVAGQVGGGVLNAWSHQYFKRRGKISQAKIPFNATGGTTYTPGDGYKYHEFAGTGKLVCSGSLQTGVEVLVVAGGGGGGKIMGGGGGAGGILHTTTMTLENKTYTVAVGGGGNGGSSPHQGSPGSDSGFYLPTTPSPLRAIAKGGGGGGSYSYQCGTCVGQDGGSGGGMGGNYPTTPNNNSSGTNNPTGPFADPGWQSYGHGGGSGSGQPYGASGGGGAAGGAGRAG